MNREKMRFEPDVRLATKSWVPAAAVSAVLLARVSIATPVSRHVWLLRSSWIVGTPAVEEMRTDHQALSLRQTLL